jgi:hypothetical protein
VSNDPLDAIVIFVALIQAEFGVAGKGSYIDSHVKNNNCAQPVVIGMAQNNPGLSGKLTWLSM